MDYKRIKSLLYLLVTEFTNPYDWSVFICVRRRAGFDSTSPNFVRSRASHEVGSDDRLAKKRNRAPISEGRVVLTQFVQMYVAFQPRAGCVFLELF